MAEEEKETQEPKKKGGLVKIIIIVVAVLVLAIGGFLAYTILFSGSKDNATEEVVPQADPVVAATAAPVQSSVASEAGIMYDLSTFIVNLSDPSGTKYLRVAITAEIPPKNEKLQLEIDQKLPKIKDAIITVLSSKTFEEINNQEGKKSLKREIARRINALLAQGRLMDVYITDFIIQ